MQRKTAELACWVWASRKLVESLYTRAGEGVTPKNPPPLCLKREGAMRGPLPPEKEAQAQQLAHDLAEAAHEDFLRIARTLVGSDDASLFGDTELKVRDLVLKLAARAYQQHLAQKKTATRGRA